MGSCPHVDRLFHGALDAARRHHRADQIRLEPRRVVEALEWTVNAYGLSFAALLLTVPHWATALGAGACSRPGSHCHRRLGGLRTFGKRAALIAARAVQGVGAALVMPLAMALLGAAFPREQRAKRWDLRKRHRPGVIAGPVVGGAIAAGLALAVDLLGQSPHRLVALALVYWRIEEAGASTPRSISSGSAGHRRGTRTGVGLMRANAAGWASLQVAGALALGAVLAAIFIGTSCERPPHGADAPVRLTQLLGRQCGGFLPMVDVRVVFLPAAILQNAQGFDPLGTGLRLLP